MASPDREFVGPPLPARWQAKRDAKEARRRANKEGWQHVSSEARAAALGFLGLTEEQATADAAAMRAAKARAAADEAAAAEAAGEDPPLVQPVRLRDGFLTEDAETIDADGPAFFRREDKPLKPAELIAQFGLEAICDAIADGESMRAIATRIGVTHATFLRWISGNPERQAKYRAALALSAISCDDKALQELESAQTVTEIARAREVASHLRWRAKVRNPRDYGDRQQVDHDHRVTLTPDQQMARLDALNEKYHTLTRSGQS